MPPSVALLNYISSGILWRIFCQTGIFAGFSLLIINLAVRISAGWQGTLYFYGAEQLTRARWMGRGAGNIIYQSLFGPIDLRLWQPEFGPEKKREPLCFWKFRGVFSVYFVGRISEAAMGGPRSSFRESSSSLGRVHHSSVGCSLAQWKDIRPWRPEKKNASLQAHEGKHFFLEIVLFFIFGGAAKLRWAVARSARLSFL